MKHNNSDITNSLESTKSWQGRTVLVTGISGFVGAWLAATLLDRGAEVVGIVRDRARDETASDKPTCATSLTLLELDGRAHLVKGSIADYALVERTLATYAIDTVFHLAAETIVGIATRSPISFFESNIKGTWNILEAARTNKQVERIVVASSDKAYGDQKELPYTEDSTLNGLYPYDASKACTDILSRAYARTYNLPIVVTRCANVYGGADLNWSRLVPGTIRSILRDKNPVLRSDGTAQRDYIYADDAVNAYLLAGESAGREDVYGRAFNFGSGKPVSARAMVETLIEQSGQTHLAPDIQGKGKPYGEIDRQYLDSSQAHHILGWQPNVTLANGLQKTIGWFKEHADALNMVTACNTLFVGGGLPALAFWA